MATSTPDNSGYMVERAGPYASATVLSDADVIEMVKGLSGDNTVRFERLTSPSTRLDWNDVRASLATFLRGNPVWQAGASWFLGRVEQEFPDGTTFVQAYNPLALPETLYNCATTQTPDYVPLLAIAALSKDGPRHEALVGTLAWDGKVLPTSVQGMFEGLSEGIDDVPDYYLARTIGAAWEMDEELVRRHGLRYSWLSANNPGPHRRAIGAHLGSWVHLQKTAVGGPLLPVALVRFRSSRYSPCAG